MPKAPLAPTEYDIQVAFIEWCRLYRDERELALHVPNESVGGKAWHGRQTALGRRTGAADVLIPAGRGGWHGMWLELKAPGRGPTRDQHEFADDMTAAGYYCAWADSLDLAIALTVDYMAGKVQRAGAFLSQPAKPYRPVHERRAAEVPASPKAAHSGDA